MVEDDINAFLERNSMVKLYFKEKGIKPVSCNAYYAEGELVLEYTLSENSKPQREILAREVRENLLAKRILKIEEHFPNLE
jgi:hypothetical protein